MNAMKNIKKPAYAVEMGQGNFAGLDYQCMKCGVVSRGWSAGKPYPQSEGRCPETSSGNHIWQQI